jgi:hypothetical protein
VPSARENLNTLFQNVHRLTEAGVLNWQRAEGTPFSYSYQLPDGSRVVIDSRDDDGQPPLDFLIFSAEGDRLGELSWSAHQTMAATPLDQRLQRVYDLARDKSEGLSDRIADMINQLPRHPDDEIPF